MLKDGLLAETSMPLTAFSQSIESEWIRSRHTHLLSECRRLLLSSSSEGVVYDVSEDSDGKYDVMRRVGVHSPKEDERLYQMLHLEACKVSVRAWSEVQIAPEYHSFLLLLHAAIREAITLSKWAMGCRFTVVRRASSTS